MELVDLFGMPRADVPETHMLANASRACDDGIPPATTGSGTTNNALAAMQNATAGRFFTRRVFTLRTMPPLMVLVGHNPSHEANVAALRNFGISAPISHIMV